MEHRNRVVHAPEQFSWFTLAFVGGHEASQCVHIDTVLRHGHGDDSQSGELGERLQSNRERERIHEDDAVQIDQHVQYLLQTLRCTGGQDEIVALRECAKIKALTVQHIFG